MMKRYLMPTVIAGAITAIVLVFAAYADGMTWHAPAAILPASTIATPAVDPPAPGAEPAQGRPAGPAATDASPTAGASGERPVQLAERWRGELAQSFGGLVEDLDIEFRYPVDVESEPNPFGRGFGPAGDA